MPTGETISKASKVELSLVIMAAIGIAGGATWATRVSVQLEARKEIEDLRNQTYLDRFTSIKADIGRIEKTLKEGTLDRWSGTQMNGYVLLLNEASKRHTERLERALGVDAESLPIFNFPDPDEVRIK